MIYNDLEKIIKHYGISTQIIKFAEATLELQESVVENIHYKGRTDNIAEKLADVMVLLEQIMVYYGIPTQTIQGIIIEKVKRQLKRIEEEKK